MAEPLIRRRPPGDPSRLPGDLHPVVRRVYAARGVCDSSELALGLSHLLPPGGLLDIERACDELAAAIRDNRRIVIAGDYDADGATGTALAVLGLRALGARQVDYVVPDRFRMGYGLSPELVEAAAAKGADVLVTVDNGIASHAGVAAARAAGLRVIVTDHHLAGETLPDAHAIVNPNRPDDAFAGKHLAGVGVMFYVLTQLRARLRDAGAFRARPEPNLAEFLDLVALGTVADVVKLDRNNRILVAQGLARMRAGRMRPGLRALLQVAGRSPAELTAQDLGFVLGPRLNAAGRLEDMRIGIECLLSDDFEQALALAQRLDHINRERRELESDMQLEALTQVENSDAVGLCLHDPGWHEGVVGLVASRVKERLHRPVIAFARAQQDGWLKGSARSIPGLHVRDALATVDARHPGLIERYGGHAMAAGLTLSETNFDLFAQAFDQICRERLDDALLERVIETDGELSETELTLDTAKALESAGPWGQGFPEPNFEGRFGIVNARVVGERHVKYQLRTPEGRPLTAVHFGGAETIANDSVRLVYRLVVNRWQGLESPELQITHVENSEMAGYGSLREPNPPY